MLRFNGAFFVTFSAALTVLERTLSHYEDDIVLPSDELEDTQGTFGTGVKYLEGAGLTLSLISLKRLVEALGTNPKCGILRGRATELRARIEDELLSVSLLQIPAQKKGLYENLDLFGEEVSQNFPSAVTDIEEAGKCLATDRHTAGVFHLMRVLERGLSVLAAEFGVPADHANWQNIINQIEKKINQIDESTHGATWKDDQQFYSESAAQFRLFKNAWRNHVSHAKAVYTEEKAQQIFDAVKAFMQHIAGRLKEPT